MNQRQTGSLVPAVAIALFASVVGSVITLVVTRQFEAADPATPVEQVASVQAPADTQNNLPANTAAEQTLSQIDALRDRMQGAVAERAQLTESVRQLSEELTAVQQQLASLDALASQLNTASLNAPGSTVDGALAGEQFALDSRGERPNRQADYDVNGLVEAGIDPPTAQRLKNKSDQYILARLELQDQAARENWLDTDQFRERMRELEESRVDLRDELGDDAYDSYLHEAGRNNRVTITSVIAGSAAEQAGLKPGDQVSSYNNRRIFHARELVEATRSGTRGDYVPMLVDRGGRLVSTDIVRGPLGVTLEATRVTP